MGADWGKSIIGTNRLESEGKLQNTDGGAFYEGYPLIHRDSSINGGIYLGSGKREALFVDFDSSSGLRGLYQDAKVRATVNGEVDKGKILNAVFDVVKGAMECDAEVTDVLVLSCGAENDKPMNLDIFVQQKAGVCRHMALATAVLLEQFKKEGHIHGVPSVDRNATFRGGHAWCRYTNSAGKVFILDPAQDYIGSLEAAPDEKRWPYERPEDF